MTQSMRSTLLRANGIVLTLFGVFGLSEDLFSYFAGQWVMGDALYHNTLAVGFVEAHALAIIIASLMIRQATLPDTTIMHQTALAVHVLLAAVNIFFWQGFVEYNIVPLGIIATVFHFICILAHSAALWLPRREAALG